MFDDTKLTKVGTNSEENFGIMNPPIYRASTIHFPTIESFNTRFDRRFDKIVYGSYGTPTTHALETAIKELERAKRSVVLPSGTAAISLSMLTFLKPGDHLLVSDSVYNSTRGFCEKYLSRLQIKTTYFPPNIGRNIETLIQPNTRMVFLESPGSFTFETHDIPAITEICRSRGVLSAIDNTWASPLFFKPLDHGIDISIQAATKYLCGHSDVMMGSVSVSDESLYKDLKDMSIQLGNNVSPADCYLALRGMRTMGVRLRQHQKTTLELTEWLSQRKEVDKILYPAWPKDPGHKIWRRDFLGASGLFGLLLKPINLRATKNLIEGMEHFRVGASWGGHESLIIPAKPIRALPQSTWFERGTLLRMHVGLEDIRDLINDLEKGFARLLS